MGTIVTDDKHYKNIANVIREKTGSEEMFTPEEMPGGIDGIYEAGKQAQYDEFWLNVANNQARASYYRGFNYWANEYIRPPFKIVPTARQGHHYIVQDCKNLLKVEKAYFDLSQISDLSQTNAQNGNLGVFSGCSKLIEIEDVGLPAAAYSNTFYDCVKLEKIAVVRAQEDTIFAPNTFGYCSRLRDLTMEGVIGTDIRFDRSPLSVESMKSIISHLKDYSGTEKEGTYTVTFTSTCKTALGVEGNTSPNGNTWTQYVYDLGWNL